MTDKIKIEADDLTDGQLVKLLEAHRQDMLRHSPASSVHALDVDALHHPSMCFWRATINGQFAACAGLKQLDSDTAEIKSMKTMPSFTRRGLAKALLENLIVYADAQGYRDLYLETGSMDVFVPARSLYSSMGFYECGPFADYGPDPHSVFMRLNLI